MYEEILIPTDGSRGSLVAADHGVSVAKRFGAAVHVLSAVDRGGGRSQESERDVDAVAESIRDSYPEGSVFGRIGYGPPAEVILWDVDEHGIDIVVMGTHGRSGIARYVLGSVTAAVVRSSPIPVLTVHRSARAQRTEYTDVLIVTDGTDRSRPALTHGIAIADRYNALAHAVYVLDREFKSTSARELEERTGENALRAVTREAAERDVPTVESNVRGVPYEAVLSYANEHGVDVIVWALGEPPATDDVAERLIRSAPMPVLAVR